MKKITLESANDSAKTPGKDTPILVLAYGPNEDNFLPYKKWDGKELFLHLDEDINSGKLNGFIQLYPLIHQDCYHVVAMILSDLTKNMLSDYWLTGLLLYI